MSTRSTLNRRVWPALLAMLVMAMGLCFGTGTAHAGKSASKDSGSTVVPMYYTGPVVPWTEKPAKPPTIDRADCVIDPSGNCITPAVSVSASPSLVVPGQQFTVGWSSSNTDPALGCDFDGSWGGHYGLSGAMILALWNPGTYTFIVKCYGYGTYAQGAAVVTVQDNAPPPPVVTPPTASISANPTSITYGEAVRVSWSCSSNATSANASWAGPVATSGFMDSYPNTNSTYYITCTNSAGSDTKSVFVSVYVPPPPPPPTAVPVVTLTANPSTVTVGGSTTLTWSATNSPTSCTASDGWSGSKATSGPQAVGPLSVTTTFTLICINSGGNSQPVSVKVTVTSVPAPQVNLTADQTSITMGASTTLRWSASGATSCSATWTSSTTISGSQSITPAVTDNYTITCKGDGGSTTSQPVQVIVNPAPLVVDNDHDTIPDSIDNCGKPGTDLYPNTDQLDTDGNGVGDPCDILSGVATGLSDSGTISGNTVFGTGGCGGSAANRWLWAVTDKFRYKQRVTGLVFFGYGAAISVCVNQMNHKIVAFGSRQVNPCCIFKPIWNYDAHPDWVTDNIYSGGSKTVGAKVTDSFTGCPLTNILGLGCNKVNVIVTFTINGSGTFTAKVNTV